ncbi:MAG: PD-(D/E)XK nuclease family protein, partial [Planctomycetes bacterium]|nr:PD-(D/E)XK nuclease family protein [Planctomycetota bacterium]
AFKLRYIDGVRTPPTPSLFQGKRVHSGLETFYRHRQLGIQLEPADVIRRMNDSWDAAVADDGMSFNSTADEEVLKDKAGDLVGAYLNHVPSDEPVPILVETSLEAPLIDPANGEDLGIPLLGIIDLVIDNSNGPVISDFKTAAKSTPPAAISHEIQLTAYSYLFRHAAQRTEAGLEIRSIVKTKTPQIAFHRFAARTDAHFGRLFAVIRGYLDDLHSGRFVFRPGFGCGMCDFRDTRCHTWSG